MVTATQPIVDRRVVGLFAEILDYPSQPISDEARRCAELVRHNYPRAAELLDGFVGFMEEESLGHVQEIYTGAFDLDTLSDLNATCYPYVGHHLLGESHKRSAFLVGLRKRFRENGFAAEPELPDHLVVLLRFISVCEDDELVDELLYEAMLPALVRMVGGSTEQSESPTGKARYQDVLRALVVVLEVHAPPGAARETEDLAEKGPAEYSPVRRGGFPC